MFVCVCVCVCALGFTSPFTYCCLKKLSIDWQKAKFVYSY